MKKDLNFYLTMFSSTFMLSAFTFGGGFVIIPLMKKKFVEDLKWIDDDEMMDLAAIAQSSPGPVAVNCSILIGYKLSGYLGAVITVTATILPPLIILSIISIAYDAFKTNIFVQYALRGMQAGVGAVITDVVYGMAKNILTKKQLIPIAVMVAAFIATFFFSVNVAIIILSCGLIGLITTLYAQKKEAV